jgi:hypothetical protein
LEVGLGKNQVPLSRCDLSLRRDHVKMRQRSDRLRCLIVLVELLGGLQSLLCSLDLFLSRDEIPVTVLCLRQGGVDLLQEPVPDDLYVVSRDDLETPVGRKAKTIGQFLDEAHGHPSDDIGIVDQGLLGTILTLIADL